MISPVLIRSGFSVAFCSMMVNSVFDSTRLGSIRILEHFAADDSGRWGPGCASSVTRNWFEGNGWLVRACVMAMDAGAITMSQVALHRATSCAPVVRGFITKVIWSFEVVWSFD